MVLLLCLYLSYSLTQLVSWAMQGFNFQCEIRFDKRNGTIYNPQVPPTHLQTKIILKMLSYQPRSLLYTPHKPESQHIELVEHVDYEVEYVEYAEDAEQVSEISDSDTEGCESVCSMPDTCATGVSVLDNDYMSAEQVSKLAQEKGKLVIVVDGAVYDLSEYKTQNALVKLVLTSLNGTDASWQFWRMNTRQQWEDMQQYRVGVTCEVKVKYSPPKERFFSLMRQY